MFVIGILARWSVVAAVCAQLLFAVVITAQAEEASPQAFVEAIYKAYLGKDSKGVPLASAAAIRRYFAPPLAAAIIKDRAAADKRGDAPTLDGDPFVDAQDWEISNLNVSVKMTGNAAAVATVNFTNFKDRRTVTLDLVKVGNDWRIAEIRAPSGSLRKLMRLK